MSAKKMMKSSINFLLLTLFIVLLFSHPTESRKVNCRKYVHMPECRGIAAKRDTLSRLNDDFRVDEREQLPNSDMTDNLNSRNLLIALLKRAVEKSIEYDTGTGNYLK